MIPPHSLNYVAIVVSAVLLWVLGAIWYSPALFAKPWMEILGIKKEEGKKSGLMLGMVASFIGDLVLSFILAHIISWANAFGFATSAFGFGNGCVMGVLMWIGFIEAPNLPQGIYEGRPLELFAINGGYWLVGLFLVGGLLGPGADCRLTAMFEGSISSRDSKRDEPLKSIHEQNSSLYFVGAKSGWTLLAGHSLRQPCFHCRTGRS